MRLHMPAPQNERCTIYRKTPSLLLVLAQDLVGIKKNKTERVPPCLDFLNNILTLTSNMVYESVF